MNLTPNKKMKHPVYKIAAMALLVLPAFSAPVFAQENAPSPQAPVQPAPAAQRTVSQTSSYSYATPAYAAVSTDGNVYYQGMQQDSAYRKKMQKLQEQMRDLQKEMSSLRVEESRKASAEAQKRVAERMKDNQQRFKDIDKRFANKFQNFGQRFGSDRNEDLEKKVQSGDVKLKTKAYTKSYTIDANDKLQIDNSFGKITVNVWNKNEIKVDVDIKAYADDDDKAKELLDLVNINDNKSNDGVSFTTRIGDEGHKNNFWGTMTSNGKTSVRKTIINYTVYMPSKNALTINNSYGAVILPELSGKLSINNSFGNLIAKALTNAGNEINVKYCDANIVSLNGCDLKVAFGSLNLESADKLNADIKYSPAKIGKLSTSANINMHFGDGLQIGNLDRNLKTLSIKSSYAPVKLSSLANDNADFDVTTQHGDFTYDNSNVNVTSKSPADGDRGYSSTKTYKGHIGKGSNDKVIIINTNSSYVKFDQ
jgi:hypothetical protein